MNFDCDNCKKEERFEGWSKNEDGIQVLLCKKCKNDDLAKKIYEEKYKLKYPEGKSKTEKKEDET